MSDDPQLQRINALLEQIKELASRTRGHKADNGINSRLDAMKEILRSIRSDGPDWTDSVLVS